jgi:hypothetical protein
MSDRKGSRYDAIEALTEDVEELTKEVSKLITTSNKRGREIIELRDSNNEIVVLLRDMRNLVSKEAMQRLHQQISSTATAEISGLGQELRDDLDRRLQEALREQVTPTEVSEGLNELQGLFQQKLGHLEKYLQQLQQQLQQQFTTLAQQEPAGLAPLREELQALPTEEHVQQLLKTLRSELRTELHEELKDCPTEDQVRGLLVPLTAEIAELAGRPTEDKVRELLAPLAMELAGRPTEDKVRELLAPLAMELADFKETHPSDERVQELLESRVTEERVRELAQELAQELLAGTLTKKHLDERLASLPQGVTAELIDERLTALPKGLTREDVQELLTALPKKLDAEELRELIDARTRDLLTPYLRKDEIVKEAMMRQILDLAIDTAMKQELDRAQQFYVSKEKANATYLMRDEWEAIKSIIVTRNDLETLGKNELGELRAEQEIMRRSTASREHLKMLRGEFEDVRNRCEVLEGKLESVSGTLKLNPVVTEAPAVVAPAVVPSPAAAISAETITALQQQIHELRTLLPESKIFNAGGGSVKYLKVGDSRFLLSSGFPLNTEEVDFVLEGIELPESQLATQSQKEFSSLLAADGHLIFRRLAEGAVVKRFMFWY